MSPVGFTDLPLLSQIKGRLSWLDERQRVIAQNVANADTPGYVGRDLQLPADFAAALRDGGPLAMARTSAMHIAPAGQAARFDTTAAPDSETTTPSSSITGICPNGFNARYAGESRSWFGWSIPTIS